VKIKGEKKKEGGQAGGMMFFMNAAGMSGRPVNGLILSESGHVLVPSVIKPGETERIEVWIGDKEYAAKMLKANEQLGMSIVKIDTTDKLFPVKLSNYTDLETGSWCIIVEATDEDKDFQKLKTLGSCRGIVDDFYRQFMINSSAGADGALVVSTKGKIAGIAQGGRILAMSDLYDDVMELLTESTKSNSSATEEAKKKAWIGLVVDPVNKEYAASKDISRSSLWVTRASPDGPAAAAGVQDGDIIVELYGKPLRLKGNRAAAYFHKALRPKEGKPFTLTVLRNGTRKECSGTFVKKPEDETLRSQDIGITIKKITDTDYFSYGLSTMEGVLVTDVEKGSPAATSGSFRKSLINKNDVILEMAGKPTRNIEEFRKVLESVQGEKSDVLLLKYSRGIGTGYAGLNLRKNGKGEIQ
jgi:serine protease Do